MCCTEIFAPVTYQYSDTMREGIFRITNDAVLRFHSYTPGTLEVLLFLEPSQNYVVSRCAYDLACHMHHTHTHTHTHTTSQLKHCLLHTVAYHQHSIQNKA